MHPIAILVVGFAAGIVASVIAWWLVLAYFTPRLEVSKLNRLPESTGISPCGYRYRIKIRNRLGRYAVSELSLNARLVIKGLDEARPDVRTSLRIPFGEGMFPLLEGRRVRETVADSERVYTLRVHELDATAEPALPPEIRAALKLRTARIEDLLELGSDAFVRFAVTASHARSGYSRTYFRKFRLADLCDGEFRPDSVDVQPRT